MNYKTEYLEDVFAQLAKIPKNVRIAIVRAIDERLTVAPHKFKPLVCQLKGFFRMRIGDYRVIYKIYEDTVTVLIVKIDSRGSVYK
jgi:mRNA-degrading endonuclease RelE of RelBE toxin-antitoxin system